jgi:exonuclease III
MKLRIYSFNVQGLKNATKKINLTKFVLNFQPSILCLQETNINVFSDQKIIIPGYIYFYNSATTRSSGTAIYVSSNFTVVSHEVLVDAKLQKITISGNSDVSSLTIYNCHMPHSNPEAVRLINILEQDISGLTNSLPVLSGDWNYVDDVNLDFKNHPSDRPNIRSIMKGILYNFNLTDSFRFIHPTRTAMTHTGVHAHKPQARLDRIYIPIALGKSLQSAEILPSFSDHAIVSCSMFFGPGMSCRTWKIDNAILCNTDFQQVVSDLLDSKCPKRKDRFQVLRGSQVPIEENCLGI